MLNLNVENFEQEVLQADQPVLVDFWAPWCGPCVIVGPIIEELSEEINGIKMAKLNVDNNQQLAAKYGVRGIPTVILFKDGEVQQRLVGVRPKSEYKRVIEKNK